MSREFERDQALKMAEVPRFGPMTVVRDTDADGEPGDGLTLDGYGSVFNDVVRIDSWEGSFREEFLSGSMKKTFRDDRQIIQFDHGRHPVIGSLPIARFEPGFPREDTDPERAPKGGAHVIARMHAGAFFEPVREVIASGAVAGMSHRFAPVRERWFWPDGKRITDAAVIEAELYRTWREDVPDEELLLRQVVEAAVREMGPVVWPAYENTSVGVRFASRGNVPDLAAVLHRSLDTTDLPAAPEPESPGGEETDAERQAVEASASKKRAERARALSIRGL